MLKNACAQKRVRSKTRALKNACAQKSVRSQKRALKKACAHKSVRSQKRAITKACVHKSVRSQNRPLTKLYAQKQNHKLSKPCAQKSILRTYRGDLLYVVVKYFLYFLWGFFCRILRMPVAAAASWYFTVWIAGFHL